MRGPLECICGRWLAVFVEQSWATTSVQELNHCEPKVETVFEVTAAMRLAAPLGASVCTTFALAI